MSEPIILTAEDFVDSDYIMVRPALVRKLGDLAGVLLLARIQFRSNVSRPDADGLKWWKVSSEEISEETGLSADQVRRTLNRLLSKGLVLARIDNENPWDRTKSYRVPVRQMHLAIPPDGTGDSARCTSGDSAKSSIYQEVEEQQQEKNTPPAPAEPDPFDVFWSVYPSKKGKIAAKKAFGRALKSTDLPTILAGVERYKLTSTVMNGYVKEPATWLNGGHWDDEPEAPRPVVARPGGLVERNGQMMTRANAEAYDIWQSMTADAPQQLQIEDPAARARQLEGAPW